jgi:protein-tyrosine phosphatase
MAQEIFNALAEDRKLPFRAESAGTAALEGRPMAENSLAALEEVGIYPEPHHARQVNAAIIGEAEMVLAMTAQHATTLRRLGCCPPQGIYTLPEYATGVAGEGIPDPYGLSIVAHRSTLRQLYEYVEHVVRRLGASRRQERTHRREGEYPYKDRPARLSPNCCLPKTAPETTKGEIAATRSLSSVQPRLGFGRR